MAIQTDPTSARGTDRPRGLIPRFPTRAVASFSKTAILAAALVLAVALNIATVTVDTVFHALSGAVAGVSSLITKKPVTVKSRHDLQIKRYKHHSAALSKKLSKERRLTWAMRRQINMAENHMHALDKYGQSLKNYKTELRKTVKTTSTRISRRIARATARNTSSIFAEAMPYIGIPVVLAAASWDIKDACDTMKDLEELDLAFNPESADVSAKAKVCGATLPSKDEVIQQIKTSPSAIWGKTKELYDSTPDLPSLPSWSEITSSAKNKLSQIVDWVIEIAK